MSAPQHRKRFDGGRMSVEEYHSTYAFGPNAKCAMCHVYRPMTRFVVMIPYDELKRRDKDFALLEMMDPGRIAAMMVPLKHGMHVRVSTQDVCAGCTPAAERVAARSPSWAVVNIIRAPKSTVMVGGGSTLPT